MLALEAQRKPNSQNEIESERGEVKTLAKINIIYYSSQ